MEYSLTIFLLFTSPEIRGQLHFMAWESAAKNVQSLHVEGRCVHKSSNPDGLSEQMFVLDFQRGEFLRLEIQPLPPVGPPAPNSQMVIWARSNGQVIEDYFEDQRRTIYDPKEDKSTQKKLLHVLHTKLRSGYHTALHDLADPLRDRASLLQKNRVREIRDSGNDSTYFVLEIQDKTSEKVTSTFFLRGSTTYIPRLIRVRSRNREDMWYFDHVVINQQRNLKVPPLPKDWTIEP